jgi:hypothetical protein
MCSFDTTLLFFNTTLMLLHYIILIPIWYNFDIIVTIKILMLIDHYFNMTLIYYYKFHFDNMCMLYFSLILHHYDVPPFLRVILK